MKSNAAATSKKTCIRLRTILSKTSDRESTRVMGRYDDAAVRYPCPCIGDDLSILKISREHSTIDRDAETMSEGSSDVLSR